MNIEQLIIEQHELDLQLKSLKAKEASIRKQICDELLSDKAEGTHKFQFGNIMVKAIKKFNYSLDQDMIRDLMEDGDLSEAELEAIKVKYELNLTNYRKLPDSGMLDECITMKDAMPSLEVEFI